MSMDFEFADKVWSKGKIRSLVFGASVPDTDSWDGYADIVSSYYQLRRKALDMGSVELIHDCIQLEQSLNCIEDNEVRAALVLKMNGWTEESIGAVLKSRRTGRQLLSAGVDLLTGIEAGKRL